ncbi:hypothetical protein ACDX78_03560 [Virgibacillus oceani]
MGKILILSISAMMTFVFSACDSDNSDSGMITEADLTERENAILSITAEQSFVFDYSTDGEYEELTVWVEKYEFGELVDDRLNLLNMAIEEDGSIILATSGETDTENQLSFHNGISTNGNVGVSRNETTLPDETFAGIWGSNPHEMDPAEGELVFASILYSSEEGGSSSLPMNFYEDVDEHINELEEYDIAFLLKGEFNRVEGE